jgi:uncharacterized protein
MTPQEQEMLNDLIRRVQQTRVTDKDPEAETLLQQQLGRDPDALYVLAQTVLVQKYALEQAKGQIDTLRQQSQQQQSAQPPAHTSFLGSLLGRREPPPPPPPSPNPPPPQYAAAPGYARPAYSTPSYDAPPAAPPSGGSSFLRGAATTAAGVAAGALAFEGIESLMHGFGHSAGFGGGGFMGQEAPIEETVVNNYYDDPNAGQEGHGERGGYDRADTADDSGQDAANLQDASDDLSDQDDASMDDASFDDSSYDDGGDDLA